MLGTLVDPSKGIREREGEIEFYVSDVTSSQTQPYLLHRTLWEIHGSQDVILSPTEHPVVLSLELGSDRVAILLEKQKTWLGRVPKIINPIVRRNLHQFQTGWISKIRSIKRKQRPYIYTKVIFPFQEIIYRASQVARRLEDL